VNFTKICRKVYLAKNEQSTQTPWSWAPDAPGPVPNAPGPNAAESA